MSEISDIKALQREVERLKTLEQPRWVYTNDPRWVGTAYTFLSSTSFDGDAFGTTAKTLIDLSASFGAPANIRAIDVYCRVNDSLSAGGEYYMILDPTNSAGVGKRWRCPRSGNDHNAARSEVIMCDANGDIYYQIVASGAGNFDVIIQIYGYLL